MALPLDDWNNTKFFNLIKILTYFVRLCASSPSISSVHKLSIEMTHTIFLLLAESALTHFKIKYDEKNKL